MGILTDYSQPARDIVDKAMESLLRLQEQCLGANAGLPDVYADETDRRMRFDVLEDQDALEGASYNQVRACFLPSSEGLSFATTKTTPLRGSGMLRIWCSTTAVGRR